MVFKKVLSYRTILLITINSIIGSGLFFLPAIGAKYAGPASVISWIVLSVTAIYTAMVFAEMVAMYPKSGGIYEFTKNAFGKLTSFVIGWIAWIVGNVTTAMLIVGAIQYLLPLNDITNLTLKLIISLFWVFIFNFMAYKGMKTSSFMLVTFAIITLGIILMLIIPSLMFLDISKLQPFFIYDGFWKNFASIFITIFFISEAFFGLESVMFLAEETKDPEKVLPKALIRGTLIIAVLTISLVVVSLMVVDYKTFSSVNAPFAYLAGTLFGNLYRDIIVLGTYLVILGAAAGWVVTGPRLIISLTRDKLFPPKFGAMHPIYNSPFNAIKFQGLITSTLIIIGFVGNGYKTLLATLIPLVLVMMSIASMSILILRIKKADLPRPYKAHGVFVLVPLLICFNIFLIITWLIIENHAWSILWLGSSLILVGFPIYFFLETQYNPKSLLKIKDSFIFLENIFIRIIIPSGLKEKIINLLGDIKGKKIYEYGCSIGGLTENLVEETGKEGLVYATDFSQKRVEITKIKILKKGGKILTAYYDEDHHMRIHPSIPKVDAIVSIGGLSEAQDIDNILSEMNERLSLGNKVVFVEYDKIFYLMQNINWLSSDSLIKHIFRRNGFLVNIEREWDKFWEVVIISGKKVIDISDIPKTEKIEFDEVFQDLQEINLYEEIKDLIYDRKEKIIEQERAIIFYYDRALNNQRVLFNEYYFNRIMNILLSIATYFSKKFGQIWLIIKKDKENLIIDMIIEMNPNNILLLSNYNEIDIFNKELHQEKLKNIKYLRRLIALAYKGDLKVEQLNKAHNPADYTNYEEFVLGIYEQKIIENQEDYLNITITIPLSKLN